MSLLIGTIRKDAKKIRHGSTEIKSVWWGAIKVWPMAKLYFLNTGDETLEWSITNESAALHAATSATQIRLRASKSDIKLPFSYQCSENIRIKSISAVTTGHTVTLSSTDWGATGHITLGSNNYFSSDAVENPDFIITWEVKANTTLQNQVSTIKFYDLMDIIDNPSNPENCDVDPCTFTITQRPDTVLWDSSSIVYYTSNACTTKATGYTLNQYTAGTVPLYFRIEAKRESGLTYYYGQGVFGTESASDLIVSRATTSVATAATTPAMEGSVYCWKTTVSISTNEGCWGQWSQGSIAYNTNAVYTANSTQTVTKTNPKRNWIGTTAKSSNITVTMKHNDEQTDRGVVTATITGTTKITQNADTRTTSEEDTGVAYYVVGGSTDVQSYNIVKYQTVTVSCTQGATATINYSTSGLSGTLYAEFIMDPTYYGGGHLTQQVDTTTTANNANLSKTFTARSTGTATVYVIIRQNTKRKMATSVAISNGNSGNLTVDANGKLTWGSSNGDATQVAWTTPSNPLTLSHTTCAYAPASGYDYSNMNSSGKCTTSVTVASEKIYIKYTLKTAGNAISVAETSYAESGSGTNGSRTFNLTWKSNLGSWAAWPACTDAVYNISYDTNATYPKDSTQSVTKSTPTRKWNTTTQKSCVVTCDAYCGNDAETRSMTITAYWAKSNEEAQATATQNGTVRIYASKDITCYQNADTQTNAQATAVGRGAYQATPTFTISGNAAASVDSSTGKVTWNTANGDGTQVAFTQGVTWSDVTSASKATNATCTGKVTAKVNVTTEPVYIYFALTTAGNASSCSGTTVASGGNGTGERTTTVTWNSNTGSFNAWTSNLAIANASATFKSGTKSMAKTGDAKRTYNRTSTKYCTVTAYAYAGQDSEKRSATVKVVWTKEGKANYTSSGVAADAVSGSTTCEKTATATQNGTLRVYSNKAQQFSQAADTTADQTDTYTYSLATANTGASVNSTSGLVTYAQNGGVANKDVAYILGTLTGPAAISPTSHAFSIDGSSKEFTASGVSTSAGTNGTESSSRTWTITVTGTNSGKTASGTLTQSGLTKAEVTAPTPSFTYNWSVSGTGFSRNTATGTKTTVTASNNGGSANSWGNWTQSGSIVYANNAGYSAGSTNSPSSNSFAIKHTRTVNNTSARSGTLTLSITGTNVSNSITSTTASLTQGGRTYSTTEYDDIVFSVSGTGASMNNSTTGEVKWTSNAAGSVAKPTLTAVSAAATETSKSMTVSGCTAGVTYTPSESCAWVTGATLNSAQTSISLTFNTNPKSTGSWGSWTTSGSLKYNSNAGACKDNYQDPSSTPSVYRTRTVTSSSSRECTITLSGSTSTSARSATVTAKGSSSGLSTTATAKQNGDSNSNSGSAKLTQSGQTNNDTARENATITYSDNSNNCSVSSSGRVTWSSDNGTSSRSATISWSTSSTEGGKSGSATATQNANSWTASGLL